MGSDIEKGIAIERERGERNPLLSAKIIQEELDIKNRYKQHQE